METILFWLVAAYILGAVIALMIIDDINEDEELHGGELLIPDHMVLLSWAFVFYTVWVFINTWIHRK